MSCYRIFYLRLVLYVIMGYKLYYGLYLMLNIILQFYISQLMIWLSYSSEAPGHIRWHSALHECLWKWTKQLQVPLEYGLQMGLLGSSCSYTDTHSTDEAAREGKSPQQLPPCSVWTEAGIFTHGHLSSLKFWYLYSKQKPLHRTTGFHTFVD